MADIVVKGNEQITRLIGLVEENVDKTASRLATIDAKIAAIESKEPSAPEVGKADLEEVRGQLASNKDLMGDVMERLRKLDNALPVGSKVYQSIAPAVTPREQQMRTEFANMVFDLALRKRGEKPVFSDYFRAQIENTLADGGYLMPIEMQGSIVRIVENYGVARRVCRIVPMRHKVWEQPTSSDTPAVYWDTELSTPELSAPSESKITFAKPSMTAHKLIAIDTLSMEVNQDNISDLQSFVLDVFAMAFSKEEDYQCFASPGTGNEPFKGLLYDTNLASAVSSANTYAGTLQLTGATGAYNLILEALDKADESTANTGVWFFSNSIVNGLRYVKDTDEQPLFGLFTGGAPGTLLGRPYITSRVFPKMTDSGPGQADKAFMLYGDMKYRLLGDRMQMSVDVSEHAAFKETGLVLRFVERIAFLTQLTAPFSVVKTAA